MRDILVEVDLSDHRQLMTQPEPEPQPVLEDGLQLALAFPECAGEGDHAGAVGDGARVGAVFEFLVAGPIEGSIDVFAQDEPCAHLTYPG